MMRMKKSWWGWRKDAEDEDKMMRMKIRWWGWRKDDEDEEKSTTFINW